MSEENKPTEQVTSDVKENMTIDAFGNYVSVDQTQTKKDEKKGLDKKILFIIIGVVLALVVVVIILNGVGGGASGVADKYAKAYKNYDSEAIAELLPEEMLDKFEEADVDIEENLDKEFDSIKELGIKITSCTAEEKKILTKDEIKDHKDDFEDYFLNADDVSEAIIFTVTMKYKYEDDEDDEEESDDDAITIIKINGKWKVLPFELD